MGNFESKGPADMASPEAMYIHQTINENCVVVFSKSYCTYCDDVDKIFKRMHVKYRKIELDDRKDGDALQNILGHMTGAYTVPRVFVNGTCIGGAKETKILHLKKRLVEMIEQCEPCIEK